MLRRAAAHPREEGIPPARVTGPTHTTRRTASSLAARTTVWQGSTTTAPATTARHISASSVRIRSVSLQATRTSTRTSAMRRPSSSIPSGSDPWLTGLRGGTNAVPNGSRPVAPANSLVKVRWCPTHQRIRRKGHKDQFVGPTALPMSPIRVATSLPRSSSPFECQTPFYPAGALLLRRLSATDRAST